MIIIAVISEDRQTFESQAEQVMALAVAKEISEMKLTIQLARTRHIDNEYKQ